MWTQSTFSLAVGLDGLTSEVAGAMKRTCRRVRRGERPPARPGGRFGTSEPPAPSYVAKTMARLLSDPLFGAEYVRRGFERIKQFTWRAAALNYLDLYRSLLH